MLGDEAVSDADTPPLPAETTAAETTTAEKATTEKTAEDKTAADKANADKAALEIKVQPADAIFAPKPVKDFEKASTRKKTRFFGRLLRFCTGAAVIAGLGGLAWAGGTYYSHGHLPFHLLRATPALAVQQNPEHDEMVTTVRQMAEEIRALKSSIDSKDAARGAVVDNAKSQESQNNQLASGQAATGVAITNLAGRVDKLEAEVTAKLSQVNEQLAKIEQQVSASHVASRAVPHRKRIEHFNDAFDPSRDPSAPGVPRPLGSR